MDITDEFRNGYGYKYTLVWEDSAGSKQIMFDGIVYFKTKSSFTKWKTAMRKLQKAIGYKLLIVRYMQLPSHWFSKEQNKLLNKDE